MSNKANELRKILFPELNDFTSDAIVVCLLSHLLIERTINIVVYNWLTNRQQLYKNKEDLWKKIIGMDYSKKYSLIEPFFKEDYPNEAKDVWKINDLRVNIFHGKKLTDADFKGDLISKETTVNNIFTTAQGITMQLDKFLESLLHDNSQP